MKAITLHQPWATLIAEGKKRYETRSWEPGRALAPGQPLAIHAGRFVNVEACYELGVIPPYRRLPVSAVLCIVRLVRVIRTDDAVDHVPPGEREYGDWRPGRFAWELELFEVLPEPISASGLQGLWTWDEQAAGAVVPR